MAKKGTTKYLSNKQERKVAKDIGGRVVSGSGSVWSHKADARSENYLVEAKTTKKPYYVLTYEVWSKIEKEALKDGMRVPVMSIELENKDMIAVFKVFDFVDSLPPTYKDLLKSSDYSLRDNSSRIYLSTKLVKLKDTLLVVCPWQEFLDLIERG